LENMSPALRGAKPVVFVSFASADFELANALCQRLDDIGQGEVNFFLAPRKIRHGTSWPLAIERHLRRARCAIVLLSDTAAKSPWVLFETGVAYGRKVPVIPIGIAGFRIDEQKPPLSFIHGINVSSAEDLNNLIDRVSKYVGRKLPGRFTPIDHAAIVACAPRRVPELQTLPLLTRPAIFQESTRLVLECGINSRVRAATSLADPADANDEYVRPYLLALARKCSESVQMGGHMTYHVALSLGRSSDGKFPDNARKAIIDRIAMFTGVGAGDRLKLFEMSSEWSMNILLIDREHAIIGFPQDSSSTKLEYGLRVSGASLVDPMVDWYIECIERPAAEIRMESIEAV
jgi:TIR domain